MTIYRTVLFAALFAGACEPVREASLRASKLGDISRSAVRGSPVAALHAACGEPSALVPSLRREPYLQQVTSSSAIVGWVAYAPGEHALEITTPDKTVVAVTAAEASTRAEDEVQLWSHVDGLAPDTIYCYRVVTGGMPLSDYIGFRTAPAADSARTIGILAFGDSGSGGPPQLALRAQMDVVPYELAIHTGDLAYDDGTYDQIDTNVFGVYAPLFRHLPFFPIAGNHDYRTQGGAPFRDVFALPNNERWYSFDWGRVHLVGLDTQADYAQQAAWLDADLAATTLPWKIVYLHRPPYSSGEHGSDLALRAAITPVLERHGVQLVLAGHDHHYERSTPQRGTTHVVTGGGGRSTRSVGVSGFTAFSEDVIHYVYLEVGVDEMVVHAIDSTGTQFDSAVIGR